jgi:hypothetical protein
VLASLPACEAPVHSRVIRERAANVEDAPADVPDARADFDADVLDAAVPDASVVDLDAATMIDAGRDAGWGTCTYGGTMGTCMSVSDCTAGSMPVMGLCPGPADIQCCLPTADAGP